jgi:hypothetical protein
LTIAVWLGGHGSRLREDCISVNEINEII